MNVAREVTLQRELRAWALRQQGWTLARIGAEIGIDESTVSRALARIAARYATRHAGEVDAVKGAQLAQLEHIVDEAMQAWRRSQGAVEIITRKQTTIRLGDGQAAQELPGEETTTRTEVRAGDAAYLSRAMEALAAARKILGLDAPEKIAPTDPSGTRPYGEVPDDDIIARLTALLNKVGAGRAAGAADGGGD